jgi:hypothetical protein
LSSDSGEEYVPEGGEEEEVEVAEAEEEEYLAEGEEVEEDVEEDERGTGRIRRSTTKKYKGETVSIQKQ